MSKILMDDGFNPEFVETAVFDGVLEVPMISMQMSSTFLHVIRTNGKIATVFPDTDQSSAVKRRK